MHAHPSSTPAPADVGVWLDADHVMPLEDGRYALRATRCRVCAQAVFPGSGICPFCLSEHCDALPLSGDANLYSFTTLRNGPKRWAIPYAIGYADFANGVRLFAKLAAAQSEQGPWRIDQPVRLVVVREAAAGDAPERFRYFLAEGGA